MRLRPGEVEEGVLRVKPGHFVSFQVEGEEAIQEGRIRKGGSIPFFSYNALGRQPQYIETSIPYKAKVLGRSYGDSGVEEWRVFNSVAIEALGAVFEHD